MAMYHRLDAAVIPATVVPAIAIPIAPPPPPAPPRRTINPLIPICCIALILFLVAATIVLSLIPIYIQRRGVERFNAVDTQFTLSLLLRNGYLPVGPLSAENCATIQDDLRRRAAASDNVRPSVPTVSSCTVTGNSTDTGRKKRQASVSEGNLIEVVVILSAGRCRSNQCSFGRANFFISLILSAGEFILNLVRSDGSRFNFIVIYIRSSAVTSSSSSSSPSPSSVTNPDLIFYGINNQNQLLRINTQSPGTTLSTVTISGLTPNDLITEIDFRPSTGQLYGVSNGSQLYVIDEVTGVARPVGSRLISSGTESITSLEINPALDAARAISNTGGNLRVNPSTGAIVSNDTSVDASLGTSVAFNNNLAGTSTSSLFIIDTVNDRLLRQNPPGDLTITPVGSGFGIDITEACGFDIAPTGAGILCGVVGGTSRLYVIDLNNGSIIRALGDLPQPLRSLAIPTAPVAYAIITSNNSLLIVNSVNDVRSFTSKSISGLQSGESVVGLDVRPVNGQLFALGSTSRLYILNTASGEATVVGSGTAFTPALLGTAFGFDFNPTVDRIRVVSNTGQNLRLNPNTGGIAGVDTNLNPGSPNITAVAYTNNVANASTTELFDIDSTSDRLLLQNPPNNGTLVDIGPLGIGAEELNGFDIGGRSGTALALFTVSGVTRVYQINLGTGAATSVPNAIFPVACRAYALGLSL